MPRETTPDESTADSGRTDEADDFAGPLAELLQSSPVAAADGDHDEPDGPPIQPPNPSTGPPAIERPAVSPPRRLLEDPPPIEDLFDPSEVVTGITTNARIDVSDGVQAAASRADSAGQADVAWSAAVRAASDGGGPAGPAPCRPMAVVRSPGQPRSSFLPRALAEAMDRRDFWVMLAASSTAAVALIGFVLLAQRDGRPEIAETVPERLMTTTAARPSAASPSLAPLPSFAGGIPGPSESATTAPGAPSARRAAATGPTTVTTDTAADSASSTTDAAADSTTSASIDTSTTVATSSSTSSASTTSATSDTSTSTSSTVSSTTVPTTTTTVATTMTTTGSTTSSSSSTTPPTTAPSDEPTTTQDTTSSSTSATTPPSSPTTP